MSMPRGDTGAGSPATKALAFYLPQFHPIPENDAWWGAGFTEWRNVTRARPLYPGHYQPHVPGELGYYDLRIPEVRAAQADLARSHGISGFVYYHYWFQGKRLLNRPFDEVLASGEPDFPFALCWANEEWTRNWDGRSGTVLMPQGYSDADDLAHIRWLATAFADPRYITIDGRPLMLIYRPGLLPDPRRTTDRWRTEAQQLGFPDLYLCWVDGWGHPEHGPEDAGFDATVGFVPFSAPQRFLTVESLRTHRILDYPAAAEARATEPAPPWKHFPSVMVGWDSTARHPGSATIFEGATPDAYRSWLDRTVTSLADVPEEENYLFLLAWNEWAEGNHLEPDQRFGRAFLEATRSVLRPDVGRGHPEPEPPAGDVGHAPDVHARTRTNVHALLRAEGAEPRGPCVQICVEADGPRPHAGHDVIRFQVFDGAGPDRAGTTDAGPWCDIEDARSVADALGAHAAVGSVLLLDVVGRLRQPHLLLSQLSDWSRAHGDVPLVVAEANATHIDHGLNLLAGHWDPAGPDHPAHEQLHLFTEVRLNRLLERCGWVRTARDDVRSVRSDQHDAALVDCLPVEMVGALTVLSEAFNPQWAVERFVWVLTPTADGPRATSFADALAPGPDVTPRTYTDDQHRAVGRYLDSVGLVVTEANRRAVDRGRSPHPAWRRTVARLAQSSPRTASAYRRVRDGLG
jgi:hypothetical protein